jgi:flagellar protein FlbD
VIILTRLGGLEMAVNPDLIERAESTPDTVVTMVDGHKLVVAEAIDEVVDRIRRWRASVAAQAFTLSQDPVEDDGYGQRAADGTSVGPALAQVLPLPQREV